MRTLVFSDIHGSLPACRLILQLVDKYRPDSVILLGDLLFQSPNGSAPEEYDPPAAAKLLAAIPSRVIAVEGNCDEAPVKELLPFPLARDFAWILTDGMRIFLTHGHIHTPESLPPLGEGDVFLSGHTHIPQTTMQDGIALCNPGSLSLPKEDHPASYGLIEFGAFTVLAAENDEPYLRLESL